MTQRKPLLQDHIEKLHFKEISEEPNHLFAVARRMEAASGSGVRLVSLETCQKHWDTVRHTFSAKQRRALRGITTAILAEALVLIGDPAGKPSPHLSAIEDMYQNMR